MLLLAAVLTGCSTTPNSTSTTASNGLIPNTSINIGPSVSYPLEKLVYWGAWVGAAYLILDPLAPNWDIEEARFPRNQVHMQLTMKRYYAGGAGEARMIFHRRAKELMHAGGFASYEVLEYSEGMESSMLGSQRTAEGVIKLVRAPD